MTESANIHEAASPGDTVVVAGCGFGESMIGLKDEADAYGFDQREVFSRRARPPVRDRVIHGDFTDPGIVDRLLGEFGLDRIDVCYTESMLSSLSVLEAVEACGRWREDGRVGRLAHEVWVRGQVAEGTYTALTMDGWRAAVDPDGEDAWLGVDA